MSNPCVTVADASPLIIAARTGMLEHFPTILGAVTIPPTIADECLNRGARPGVEELQHAVESGILTVSSPPEHEFLSRVPHGIDAGEAEAIGLALAMDARLLIDDKKGRNIARAEGLTIFGFGAVLVKAKRLGVIEAVEPVLQHMATCNYRISDRVRAEITRLSAE